MIKSKEARRRAEAILEMLKISQAPIDVFAIAKQLGFEVVEYDFPDDTSAALVIDEDIKAIGINKNHALTRQRFSVAHELGHFLQGHGDFANSQKTFEDGSFNYADPQNRQELEANEFAAELLMPSMILKKEPELTTLDVPSLAKKYQVSEQALWIQLINLHLVNPEQDISKVF